MNKKRLAGLIAAIVVVALVGGAIAYWSIGLAIYNRGVAAHNGLDVETAIARYETVMRYYPDSLGGFAALAVQNCQACLTYQSARQAYDAAEYGTACERYDQFLAAYPTNRLNQLVLQEHPAAWLAWAGEADRPGTYLTAVERYRSLIGAYPESDQAAHAGQEIPAAYVGQGDQLRAQGEYQAAIDAYRSAIDADAGGGQPGVAATQVAWQARARTAVWETYAQWGDALRAAGDYQGAIARYQDAAIEASAASDALIREVAGAVEEVAVRDAMERAIGETYLEQAGALREGGDYQAAISLCQSAMERFPQSSWHEQMHAFVQATYIQWAGDLRAAGDYEEAIAAYRAHLQAYPGVGVSRIEGQIVTTYYAWAREEWQARRYEQALGIYEELLKAFPENALAQQASAKLPQLHYDWAADAHQEGEYETAVQHYQAGIAAMEAIAGEQALPADFGAAAVPKAYTVTVDTDLLNVRKEADATAGVVGLVRRGAPLTVLGRNEEGSWLRVKEPAGWVFASLVALESDTDVTSIPLKVEEVALRPAIVEANPSAAMAWEATARALYEWGMALYAEASYQEATARFQAVIDAYALSQAITDTRAACGQAYLAWGDVLSGTQDYEAAAEAYAGALNVDPGGKNATLAIDSAAGAYMAWARSFQAQGAYNSAILKYAVVYTDYPTSSYVGAAYAGVVSCYSAWGDALREEGKYGDAIEKYQAIATAFPKSPAAGPAYAAIGQTYNAWGAALHKEKRYVDAMAKFSLAWQATSDASVVAAAQKGYNDALWALARLTDATGQKIINDALSTACQGQAAASPAVGLATNEAGKALCNSSLFTLPKDLTAVMPAHFRYAVCVTSGANEVQRCAYTGAHALVRQQLWWKVTVRDPKTGRWIAERTFSGSTPGSCPFTYMFYGQVAYLSGGSPSGQDVVNWLQGIVK